MSKIRESLIMIMKEYGEEIYTQPVRLENLLKDFCPECKKEIFSMVSTVKIGIPKELKDSNKVDVFLINRLIARIVDELGFPEINAKACVNAWIYVFDMVGVDSECSKDNGCGNSKCSFCYPETCDENLSERIKTVNSKIPTETMEVIKNSSKKPNLKYDSNSLIPILDKHGVNIHKVLFETKVAGVTFRPDGQKILEYLSKADSKEITLKFEREPDNLYDRNAVKVIVGMTWSKKEHFIGYIGRNISDFFTYIIETDLYDIRVGNIKIIGGDKISIKNANYGLKFEYRVWIK
jgi:hypothetical protein